jgi:Flp pilus assembly protein TadB
MSKLNVGVGEEFPLDDQPDHMSERHPCSHRWRHHRRHGRGIHPAAGAFIILPAAAASVTAAILYPLATLGVIGGVGLVAAAHRHGRWQRYRDAYRRHYAEQQDKPRDTPPPPQDPKESA